MVSGPDGQEVVRSYYRAALASGVCPGVARRLTLGCTALLQTANLRWAPEMGRD